jgi:AcrR family transcriptional regulator
MRARAEAAERVSEQLLDAAHEVLLARSYDELTLQEVADRAGTSLSTLLRRFGSKEGLLATLSRSGRLGAARRRVADGDVEAAVRAVVDDYERDGDAVLRSMALEDRLPAIAEWVELGRRGQRAWISRVFAEWLPAEASGREARRKRAQLSVALDLYTWKILRRDQGLSKQETVRAMTDLVDRLIKED